MENSIDFDHLSELRHAGRQEDLIRESQLLAAKESDPDTKAILLRAIVIAYQNLGRLEEARQTLDRLSHLEIPDLEVRTGVEFSTACLLIQEDKWEEGAAAFAELLRKHDDAFRKVGFRYLYEEIQSRRATALVHLARYDEALPILREAASFSFDRAEDEQGIHFGLGVSLSEVGEADAARQAFARVIGFGLKNDLEEQARYRLANLCRLAGGSAQAKQQLETILIDYPAPDSAVPKNYIYEQLSYISAELGDHKSAKRYMLLAKEAARSQ